MKSLRFSEPLAGSVLWAIMDSRTLNRTWWWQDTLKTQGSCTWAGLEREMLAREWRSCDLSHPVAECRSAPRHTLCAVGVHVGDGEGALHSFVEASLTHRNPAHI